MTDLSGAQYARRPILLGFAIPLLLTINMLKLALSTHFIQGPLQGGTKLMKASERCSEGFDSIEADDAIVAISMRTSLF